MKQSASGATSKKKSPTSKTKKTVSSQKAPPTAGLKVGQKAPSFTLLDDNGQRVSLSDFKGKKVVVYFYPKDDTPGCTREACAFRDGIEDLRESKAVVLGVSADSVESHKKFSTKYNLNFPVVERCRQKSPAGVWGVERKVTLWSKIYGN